MSAASGRSGFKQIDEENVVLTNVDESLDDMSGHVFLQQSCEEYPGVMRLALIKYEDMISLMPIINELEIYQFIRKPWQKTCLQATIAKALEWRQMSLALSGRH